MCLQEFQGASSVSSFQPIICVPKRTHRVSCRTHRACPKTQWVLSSETVLSKQYSACSLELTRSVLVWLRPLGTGEETGRDAAVGKGDLAEQPEKLAEALGNLRHSSFPEHAFSTNYTPAGNSYLPIFYFCSNSFCENLLVPIPICNYCELISVPIPTPY